MNLKNFSEDDILALCIVNAGEPKESSIELNHSLDRNRNPHNDGPPKPPLRSREEVIADLKIEAGKALFKRMMQATSRHGF